MVKGLAKFGNRGRHGWKAKFVDVRPFQEGRLLPSDGRDFTRERDGRQCPFSSCGYWRLSCAPT